MRQRRGRLVAAVALALALALWPAATRAHPHVFVDYAITLKFSEADLAGVRLTWTFDDQFSSGLIHDYEELRRKPPTRALTEKIQQKEFDFLKNSNYFTEISVDGKPIKITQVKDFAVSVAGERVIYSFTVPIAAGQRPDGAVSVVPFDDEYYVQFTPGSRLPVTIEGGDDKGASCHLTAIQRDVGYWGTADADSLDCTFHRKGS